MTNIRAEVRGNPSERDWRELALCAQVDPDLWFPELGENATPARLVCGWCEVRAECLAVALAANEDHGVWGGLSPQERRQLRRRQRIAVAELDDEAA